LAAAAVTVMNPLFFIRKMKAEAKACFSEVVDILENREFWRRGKALVELCVPVMNLLKRADSDI
jgi:hypothetical protein